jgi:hypothetical protein
MLTTLFLRALVEHKMAEDAPRSGDLEFHEEIEQTIDDDTALNLASTAKSLGSE